MREIPAKWQPFYTRYETPTAEKLCEAIEEIADLQTSLKEKEKKEAELMRFIVEADAAQLHGREKAQPNKSKNKMTSLEAVEQMKLGKTVRFVGSEVNYSAHVIRERFGDGPVREKLVVVSSDGRCGFNPWIEQLLGNWEILQ